MRKLTETEFVAAIDEFHVEAKEDVFGLWKVTKVVGDIIGVNDVTEESLRIMMRLLEMGLEAGRSPYEPDGYEPWPEQDAVTGPSRIRREWAERGTAPDIADSPWFAQPGW